MFLQLVNDPANQPVYVHCAGGRHRTGVMTAVYRMTSDGWTADRAFKEMKDYKFGADFLHPEFKKFVYGYRLEPKESDRCSGGHGVGSARASDSERIAAVGRCVYAQRRVTICSRFSLKVSTHSSMVANPEADIARRAEA